MTDRDLADEVETLRQEFAEARARYTKLCVHVVGMHDAHARTIAALEALHGPPEGWERQWSDPAEAARRGWAECMGCRLPGVGSRDLAHCPTRKILAELGTTDVAAEGPTCNEPAARLEVHP